MSKISFKLEDGRQQLSLTFDQLFTATLNADGVDAIIAKLGEMRALMKPRVATRCPPGNTVAPENPTWEAERRRDLTMLRIRDPRFGWLRYGFTNGERLALSRSLVPPRHHPGD